MFSDIAPYKTEFFFLLFARFSGFFLLSPFFSKRLNFLTRFALALAFAFVATPALLQTQTASLSKPLFFLALTKELLVGYLLGFLFSLLFEAAAFAGQIITTMGGFSAVELFDNSSESYPLFSSLFSLVVLILFMALDLHHLLFRILYESFSLFPIGREAFQESAFITVVHAVGRMFHYGLSYALYPLAILLCFNVLFALFSRELMIFLNGFPLQIFFTFLVVALSISNFDKILIENFTEFFSRVFSIVNF